MPGTSGADGMVSDQIDNTPVGWHVYSSYNIPYWRTCAGWLVTDKGTCILPVSGPYFVARAVSLCGGIEEGRPPFPGLLESWWYGYTVQVRLGCIM